MRTILGGLFVALAFIGFLPSLVNVFALQSGQVGTPDSGPARYNISGANGFVTCSVPNLIVLKPNAPYNGTFLCTNNFRSSVYLSWSVVSDGGLGLSTGGSGDTLTADGVAACRQVSLKAGKVPDQTQTVVFRGQTSSTADFYAEIYFTAQVQILKTGSPSGGCQ